MPRSLTMNMKQNNLSTLFIYCGEGGLCGAWPAQINRMREMISKKKCMWRRGGGDLLNRFVFCSTVLYTSCSSCSLGNHHGTERQYFQENMDLLTCCTVTMMKFLFT